MNWRWTGNNITFFTGSVVAIPTKASTYTFLVQRILLIAHSFSWFRVSRTLVKYWVMCLSLASYSPWICLTTSWESLQISSLEAERASARFNPDRMTLYSASLLDTGNPIRMACSSCSPVGDCKRRPTSDPEVREAPSMCRVHHPLSAQFCESRGLLRDLRYEINHDLFFYGQLRLIFDSVLTQFYGPLQHSSW